MRAISPAVVAACIFIATTIFIECHAAEDGGHELIGWLGETYDQGARVHGTRSPQMVVLSWSPRVFLFKGLVTREECDALIQGAIPRLERSAVVDETTGAAADATSGAGDAGLLGFSESRTSYGMFYDRGETEILRGIEARLSRITMLPVENGEGLNVIRYEETQKYEPHYDFFSNDGRDNNGGGHRVVTALMYLQTPEEGGETVFLRLPIPAEQTRANFSECAMHGMAVKPVQGDVVVFWSVHPDGQLDLRAVHGSCPVTRGEKWSAVKWIRAGRYSTPAEVAASKPCKEVPQAETQTVTKKRSRRSRWLMDRSAL